MSRFRNLVLLLAFAFVDANAFVFNDVRVEGLQRISAGTVFGSLPFNVGDDLSELDLRFIIRALFERRSW